MIDFIRSWTAAVACAAYWGVGGAFFLVVGLVLGPFLPESVARRVGGCLIRFAFVGFVRLLRFFAIAEIQWVGFDKIERETGAYVLAPNHPAIWDAVFILAKIDGLTCVLKAALLRNPLVMGAARLARFIPNDPPSEMVKRCVGALEGGGKLLLFPEGTRTRKKECILNEFRGGIAIAARHAGVPVYPVFVRTDTDFGSKGSPAWRPELTTTHITMTVGDPLRCGEKESSHEFLERLRSVYLKALSPPSK